LHSLPTDQLLVWSRVKQPENIKAAIGVLGGRVSGFFVLEAKLYGLRRYREGLGEPAPRGQRGARTRKSARKDSAVPLRAPDEDSIYGEATEERGTARHEHRALEL
jgi:hypothetical protein